MMICRALEAVQVETWLRSSWVKHLGTENIASSRKLHIKRSIRRTHMGARRYQPPRHSRGAASRVEASGRNLRLLRAPQTVRDLFILTVRIAYYII